MCSDQMLFRSDVSLITDSAKVPDGKVPVS